MSITDILTHGSMLNAQQTAALQDEVTTHPYFHAAGITLTAALFNQHSADYGHTLHNVSVSIPDRTALFALIEGAEMKSASKKSASKLTMSAEGTDRTISLIDHFLGSIPAEKPRKLTVADAANDYMAYLMQVESESPHVASAPMHGQGLIDQFIDDKPEGSRLTLDDTNDNTYQTQQQDETLDENELSSEYFTETMAKIYIKQGKFDKAMKIISRLNAKYPKKNRYFADQMRFLEKLTLNQNSK